MIKQLIRNTAFGLPLWFNHEDNVDPPTAYGFHQACKNIQPGDVLLVQGRSFYSRLVQIFTGSPWTHCAIFVGDYCQIDANLRNDEKTKSRPGNTTPQLVEANLGEGVVLKPLAKYRHHNICICKPKGLSAVDRDKVVVNARSQLGNDYDIDLIFYLALFLLFQRILPSLDHRYLDSDSVPSDRAICSILVARALNGIQFPIWPAPAPRYRRKYREQRQGVLPIPSIFFHSPYFQVIKPRWLFPKERNIPIGEPLKTATVC